MLLSFCVFDLLSFCKLDPLLFCMLDEGEVDVMPEVLVDDDCDWSIAAWVCGPMMPSISPLYRPLSFSDCCKRRTASGSLEETLASTARSLEAPRLEDDWFAEGLEEELAEVFAEVFAELAWSEVAWVPEAWFDVDDLPVVESVANAVVAAISAAAANASCFGLMLDSFRVDD